MSGFGAKVYPNLNVAEGNAKATAQTTSSVDDEEDSTAKTAAIKKNVRVDFQVSQLVLELRENHRCDRLARFCINALSAHIESNADCLQLNGQLGALSIRETSKWNKGLYTERFVTPSGAKALVFDFFKYNGSLSTLSALYPYDIALRIHMSTIKYVHIQRFVARLAAYFQQFTQLQDALGRMKALSVGDTNVSFSAQRSSRIQLHITTEAPIVVIPLNSQSPQALVLNLGSIQVTNRFALAQSSNDPAYSSSTTTNDGSVLLNTNSF